MSFGHKRIPKHLIIEEPYTQKKTFGFGWVILAVVILLSSMLISLHVRGEVLADKVAECSSKD
ncbi:hypothetical protein TDB9533_02979 [Thalassocella blandensis]|nr:hypothetical protein TDB9533_02979 [Thalassocella blandensis]